MIYTDGVHVVSDSSLDELHQWARDQGIGKHFFHRGRWPHYDIPARRREEDFPAKYVKTRAIVAILMKRS
ncbi:MAG: DUF4031 domain-containing protein [Thermoplasmata archaeon]|nr:DUF4031 domain-containing protein [Thermoplasmata archaeon]